MIAALDIAAAAFYLMAFGIIAYALVIVRDQVMKSPAVFALLAMAVMVTSSVVNALANLGITTAPHRVEGYIEVLFIPLMVYVMYGRARRGQFIRESRERRIMDRLDERLSDSMTRLDQHRLGMLQALTAAVDARDHYTAQHSLHVADYSCAMAYQMGLTGSLSVFEQAGLLHDIGKIGVPDDVLLKPAHLSDEEYEVIKFHAQQSAQILATIPFLEDVVPVVRHHHEHWDGSGYPDGLVGTEIPKASRILAVADAFDAMTTDRPYRTAMDMAVVRRILHEGRGLQWDPAAIDSLLDLIDTGIITVQNHDAA